MKLFFFKIEMKDTIKTPQSIPGLLCGVLFLRCLFYKMKVSVPTMAVLLLDIDA